MEGFLPSLTAPGLITVPLRLEAFPVNTGHQPLKALTYSTAGWGSAAGRDEGTVRQILFNLMIMTKCVISSITPFIQMWEVCYRYTVFKYRFYFYTFPFSLKYC